jgi:hypothetical protein
MVILKLAQSILGEDCGVSEETYMYLRQLQDELGDCKLNDLMNKVECENGRYYLDSNPASYDSPGYAGNRV